MKEIDIEKLPRKNIYTQPENSFDVLQRRVMEGIEKIEQERKPALPIAKNNLKEYWAVAASFVLLLGLGIILLSIENKHVSSEKEIIGSTKNENTKTMQSHMIVKKDSSQHYANHDNASWANASKISPIKNEQKINKQNKNSVKPKSIPAEQMINVLPAEDIAMLTQNMELDLYLDLYQ
ncbi:hypothetical protein [Bergeyella zoohelcum]|uniref:hypothetical protein n=1 Tax=Bergeyella zoohelcum TaxID=1015 RepID=UPI00373608DD